MGYSTKGALPVLPIRRGVVTGTVWVLYCPVAVYLLLLYFRPALAYILPSEVLRYSNIVALSSAALVVVLRGRGRIFQRLPRYLLFLLAGIAVIGSSAAVAGAPQAKMNWVLYNFVGACLTFVAFSGAYESRRGAIGITVLLVACAAINSTVGVWGAVTKARLFNVGQEAGVGTFGYDPIYGRSGGIIGENYVGLVDLPALVAGLWLLQNRRWNLAGVLLTAASGAAIVVSLSKASAMAGLVAALAFSLISIRRRRSAVLLIGVVGALLYGGASYLTSAKDPAPYRKVSIQYRWSMEALINEDRLTIWRSYLSDVEGAPFLGRGPGYIAGRISAGRQVPHNSLLDILVEFGLLGVVLYVSAFGVTVRNYWVSQRRSPNALGSLLMCCFCGMAASTMTVSDPLYRVLWAVAGGLNGVRWCAEPRSVVCARKEGAGPPVGMTSRRGRTIRVASLHERLPLG